MLWVGREDSSKKRTSGGRELEEKDSGEEFDIWRLKRLEIEDGGEGRGVSGAFWVTSKSSIVCGTPAFTGCAHIFDSSELPRPRIILVLRPLTTDFSSRSSRLAFLGFHGKFLGTFA